jgi:hypothetical protein
MRSQSFLKKTLTAGCIIAAVSITLPAQGQTILIDFGNSSSFRGVDVVNPDQKGDYWNSVWAGAFYPSVLDIDGNPTAINFGFSADGGNDSFNGPAGPTSNPPTPGEIAATDIDSVALGNLGATNAAIDFYVNSLFQIQNLDPTKTYDLTFYGSHKFSTDDTTVYTVYTDNTFSVAVDSVSLDVQQPGSPWLHNRDTVVTIPGLSPQVGNILYVGFAGAGGNEGYLNALEITVVPEPTTFALLGLGGVAFALTRRRRA